MLIMVDAVGQDRTHDAVAPAGPERYEPPGRAPPALLSGGRSQVQTDSLKPQVSGVRNGGVMVQLGPPC